MAKDTGKISRTFMQYRFLQIITQKDCMHQNISLITPLTKYNTSKGHESAKITLNIPPMSAEIISTDPKREHH